MVKEFVPDITPPALVSATATSPTILEVLFNEPISAASASNPVNYVANNGIGNPATAIPDNSNPLFAERSLFRD